MATGLGLTTTDHTTTVMVAMRSQVMTRMPVISSLRVTRSMIPPAKLGLCAFAVPHALWCGHAIPSYCETRCMFFLRDTWRLQPHRDDDDADRLLRQLRSFLVMPPSRDGDDWKDDSLAGAEAPAADHDDGAGDADAGCGKECEGEGDVSFSKQRTRSSRFALRQMVAALPGPRHLDRRKVRRCGLYTCHCFRCCICDAASMRICRCCSGWTTGAKPSSRTWASSCLGECMRICRRCRAAKQVGAVVVCCCALRCDCASVIAVMSKAASKNMQSELMRIVNGNKSFYQHCLEIDAIIHEEVRLHLMFAPSAVARAIMRGARLVLYATEHAEGLGHRIFFSWRR